MRILIASPSMPWPLHSGGNAAQFSTLKCLADDHEFTFVCPIHTKAQSIHARELAHQLPNVRVRCVDCGVPRSSLTRRTLRPVARIARSMFGYGNRPSPTTNFLYYPFDPIPRQMIGALQEELERGTDLCQAEYTEMLPLGPWFPRKIPKLFIQVQIHFVYAKRFLETHGHGAYENYLEAAMRVQELAFLSHFDAVVTFSEDDRRAHLPYLEPSRVFTSPFPIPIDVGIAQKIPAAFDGRFLYVASEAHGPNRDGMDWLLAEIWPRMLRQLPSARLLVIGQWKESTKAALAAPGLSFTGFVSDLPATLRGGIMLVPVRIGSGIRVKILAALAQGVPIVTTSVGMEGLPLQDSEHALIRDDAESFAGAAVQLARQPDLWKRLAQAGLSVVEQYYSPQKVRARRNEIYQSVACRHREASPSTR